MHYANVILHCANIIMLCNMLHYVILLPSDRNLYECMFEKEWIWEPMQSMHAYYCWALNLLTYVRFCKTLCDTIWYPCFTWDKLQSSISFMSGIFTNFQWCRGHDIKWDSSNFNGVRGMGFPSQEWDIMDLEKRIMEMLFYLLYFLIFISVDEILKCTLWLV